jgi:hypothetical protein
MNINNLVNVSNQRAQSNNSFNFSTQNNSYYKNNNNNNNYSYTNTQLTPNMLHKGRADTFSFKIPTSNLYEPLLISVYALGNDDKNRYTPDLFVCNLCFDKMKLLLFLHSKEANNDLFYTDESLNIYANIDGVRHNTVTPMARFVDDQYCVELILRNNLTSEEYPDGSKKIELSQGEYDVRIEREGYDDFIQEIEIEDEELVLKVNFRTGGTVIAGEGELFGDITIYSEPGWAKVYIDGTYKGVAPIMDKLSYGEHYVKLELDGYDTYGEHIIIDRPEQTYKGVLD